MTRGRSVSRGVRSPKSWRGCGVCHCCVNWALRKWTRRPIVSDGLLLGKAAYSVKLGFVCTLLGRCICVSCGFPSVYCSGAGNTISPITVRGRGEGRGSAFYEHGWWNCSIVTAGDMRCWAAAFWCRRVFSSRLSLVRARRRTIKDIRPRTAVWFGYISGLDFKGSRLKDGQ